LGVTAVVEVEPLPQSSSAAKAEGRVA